MAFGLLFAAIFGTFNLDSDDSQVAFFTLCRTSYGLGCPTNVLQLILLGLALLTYVMLSDYLLPIREMLSWSLWAPLARLTFGAYLVHPLIIVAFYMSTRQAMNWDTWAIVIRFLAFVVISYGCSFVLWLGVEKPFMNIFAILVPTGKSSNKEEDTEPESGSTKLRGRGARSRKSENVVGSRLSMFINRDARSDTSDKSSSSHM